MHARGIILFALALGAAVAVRAQEPPRQRIRVERASDLPRHGYPITTSVATLLDDTAQFSAFAQRVEADLRTDLGRYLIEDRATLKQYYGILSDLSLQRGAYDAAAAWQDSIRAVEDKPGLRFMAGITERSLAAANRAPGDRFDAAFRDHLRRELSAPPFAQIREALATLRQGAEFIGMPNARAIGQQMVEQQARDGSLSLQGAALLVRMRTAFDRLVPVREAILAVTSEVLAANAGTAGRDIWAERDVSLEGRGGLIPVVIAIWDSGVDVDLFPGRLFVNAGEVAGNGRDDDGNGHVDDVHGIAYDLNHNRSTGVLGQTTLSPAQQEEFRRFSKGSSDLEAGLRSPEAEAFQRKLASLRPAELREWQDARGHYAEYIHGTHVAGVAMRDNPAARLLVARNEEDNWKAQPQLVTLEGEHRRVREYLETVEYFRKSGVRVANLSWGFTPNYYENILARNQAGGDAAGRRLLAREMYDIATAGLRSAIESAPDILFVTVAGNQDNDGRFTETVPASFDLPNLMTVAAVDYAGNEAAWTSYGKVDVYANGSQILSFAPGGQTVPWSGTSMAAPQVVNLAAKLLALKPSLAVAELRRSIIDAADVKTIAEGKTIRLLNPKASVQRVTGQ